MCSFESAWMWFRILFEKLHPTEDRSQKTNWSHKVDFTLNLDTATIEPEIGGAIFALMNFLGDLIKNMIEQVHSSA